MAFETIKSLSEKLKNRDISAVELTQETLKNIHNTDKNLNSFITVCDEHALSQAKAADALLQSNQHNALTGISIAQKDIFCTKGIKTSCGSKMLDNFISPYNAHVVDQFNSAGAIMVGKTNLDEFAMGSSNENSFYGPVRNPWDLNTVPGGSSGGSAAAVAAGLVPCATGTDTGGSIRQPAALCGITGLKPTYGRVSRYGMIAFASSLDQGGMFARTAEDCAIVLNTMAGFDQRDSTSISQKMPDYTADLNQPLKGLKIGVPKEYFTSALNADMAEKVQAAIQSFEKLGATIREISLPNSQYAISAYYVIAPAEASSNLSRYDGVRYGYRAEDSIDLNDLYVRSRSESFGTEVKRRIMTGTYVLSAGYYDAYYSKALKLRTLIQEDYAKAFEQVDVIMGPTTPEPAFNIGEKVDDPVSMYLGDIYTIGVNLAGLPGLSVPCGFVGKLPIGLQMIGQAFDEARLLNIAHQYQKNTDWHLKTP